MSVREGHAGSHQGKSNVKRNSPSVSQFLDELNWNVKKITIFSSHFPPNTSFCHWLKTDSLTHITLQKNFWRGLRDELFQERVLFFLVKSYIFVCRSVQYSLILSWIFKYSFAINKIQWLTILFSNSPFCPPWWDLTVPSPCPCPCPSVPLVSTVIIVGLAGGCWTIWKHKYFQYFSY